MRVPRKPSFLTKYTRFIKSDYFGLISTLGLVLVLIIFKGATGEGQQSLFKNVISSYIEETSASIISYTQSPSQLADISSMVAVHSNEYGTGGQDTNTNITETMDQSSVMAHNPANSEYADYVGGKRSQVMEYTVQEGDTLSFIGSDFGVTMNSIIWANNLKNVDSVKPGQILKIPPISGVIHEIKKGDTLSSIAKLYSAEEGKISDFNQLPKTGELTVGDQIIVPDGQIKTVATTKVATTAKTAAKPFSYLPNLSDFFMLPTNGFNWGKIHGRNGVDIANSCGTPIYAAAGGTVTTALSSGWNGGFGKYIKIIHDNGTETLYAHASKLLVESGSTVGKGDQIALMGTTGRSTGCHLHFEVHGAQNPLAKK